MPVFDDKNGAYDARNVVKVIKSIDTRWNIDDQYMLRGDSFNNVFSNFETSDNLSMVKIGCYIFSKHKKQHVQNDNINININGNGNGNGIHIHIEF